MLGPPPPQLPRGWIRLFRTPQCKEKVRFDNSYVYVVSGDGPPRKIRPAGRSPSQLGRCALQEQDINHLADNRAQNPKTFNEKPEKIFPDVLTLKKVCGVVTEIAKRPP